MNRNKNLLILYYLKKKLSNFSNAHKKVFHALSFQLCSTAFFFSLCEINDMKIQKMSLVLNLSILAGHGRKMGPSPRTPGTSGILETSGTPNTHGTTVPGDLQYLRIPWTPSTARVSRPQTLWDLRIIQNLNTAQLFLICCKNTAMSNLFAAL